ncbi:MAG: ABC transporter permease, partial [Rhodospirillales bacterium]|nr:ABC transporter permease [Rhodospirillales bacterium]
MNAAVRRFAQSNFLYSFGRDKVAMASFAILAVFVLLAFMAPLIAPHNPYDQTTIDLMDSEIPPVWQDEGDPRFLLGTDAQGRDMLSTILYGTRISIIIGVCAVFLQMFLGITIGLVSGYVGGRLESFFMRLADIQLSLSTLMLAIVALAIFQASFGGEAYSEMAVIMLIMVIGFAEWPQYARTIRASVLAEKKKEYVEAARVIGLGAPAIMFRHILPNTLSPLLVISTVQVANAIISEAALSFLGLGMPVTRPSLGSLINSGFE